MAKRKQHYVPQVYLKAWETDQVSDELMVGVWYLELYKMFFKRNSGFYHNIIAKTMDSCQMILFEAYDNAGTFITSDNPSFQNNSIVTKENSNGFVFPITPKYLLFIGKGSIDSIDIVSHRYANKDTIHHFNKIVLNNRNNTVIASDRTICHII